MNVIPGKQSVSVVVKIFSLILAASLFLSSLAIPAKGQYYYGEEDEVSEIVVDKTIRGLDKGEWKDNYSRDEILFGPEDIFDYKVLVKNTGNRNQTWIKITDTLPPYLDLVFGYNPDDGETFDSANRELVWKIGEIKPGEEESRIIRVRVKEENSVPKEITKITNRVCGEAESGADDCDEASTYIGNGKLEAGELPATGSELVIGSLIGIGIVGLAIVLRKYGRGEFFNK